MSDIDPYYCIVCGHQGEHEGLIGIETPCEKCGSVLIVPLNSIYILQADELEKLAEQFGAMMGEKPRKERHLKLVPTGGDDGETS